MEENKEKEYFVLYTPDEMNLAFDLFDENFSKEQIFEVLKSDDDIRKQVCLIKLSDVSSSDEAKILVSVLTGQSGPVREICSAKINEFLKQEQMRDFFSGADIREVLMNGLNDIIPTVARNILEVIKFVPDIEAIKRELLDRILVIDESKEDFEALSNHEIIKQTFKLYWYLETLAEIADICQKEKAFAEVIGKFYKHSDYTIREKVAKILANVDGFESYKEALKADENPYVFSKLR